MATRFTVKAQSRAVEAEAAIRDRLAHGDTKGAVDEAVRALRSELAKVRRHRARDGALIDAELAAQFLALASQLHRYKPVRPAACPPIPQPADTTRVFERGLARTLPTGDSR